MPIFEFECFKCKNKFEKLQDINTIPYTKCKCGYIAKRIISLSNFQLKGNGWANDGYFTTKDGYTKKEK